MVDVDPAVADKYVGPLSKLNAFPLLSVSVSARFKAVTVTFPVFSIVIVYLKISPGSLTELELTSVTDTVLVASIDGFGEIDVMVGSSVVLPSVSSPSSEVSDTLLDWPGLLPVTTALLITLPVIAVAALII